MIGIETEEQRRKKTRLGGLLDPGELTMGDPDTREPAPRKLAFSDPMAQVAAPAAGMQLGGSPRPVSPYERERQMIEGDRDWEWNPRSKFGREMALKEYDQVYKRVNDADSLKNENIRSQIAAREAGAADKASTRAARLANIQAATQARIARINRDAQLLPAQKQALIAKAQRDAQMAAATEERRPLELERLGGLADVANTRALYAEEDALGDLEKQDAEIENLKERTKSTRAKTERLKAEAPELLRKLKAQIVNLENQPEQAEFRNQLALISARLKDESLELDQRLDAARLAKELMEITKKRPRGGFFGTSETEAQGQKIADDALKLGGAGELKLSGGGVQLPAAPNLKRSPAAGGGKAAPTPMKTSSVPKPDTGSQGAQPGTDVAIPGDDKVKRLYATMTKRAAGGDQRAVKWLAKNKLSAGGGN